MAVALAALDAVVRMLGPQGERTIPLTDFYRLPGEEPQRDTVLEHGELLTAVDLPPLAGATRSHYRKVRDRASYAFALVSLAAALNVEGGTQALAGDESGGSPARRPGHRGDVWARRRGGIGRGAAPARQRLQGPARQERPGAHAA